jgi:hypothetical protein
LLSAEDRQVDDNTNRVRGEHDYHLRGVRGDGHVGRVLHYMPRRCGSGLLWRMDVTEVPVSEQTRQRVKSVQRSMLPERPCTERLGAGRLGVGRLGRKAIGTGGESMSKRNNTWLNTERYAGPVMDERAGFEQHCKTILRNSDCPYLRFGCLGCTPRFSVMNLHALTRGRLLDGGEWTGDEA